MINNGRKTIGVFMSQVNAEFQRNLCKGISERAVALDYNIIYFTNFGGYNELQYDAGEIKIADVPDYSSLDGIIIVPDTLVMKGLAESIYSHIKEHANCPVVSIRTELEDYYNVLIDDNTVLEEIIRHFIYTHGFTRINFLAGPKGYSDSDKRFASYKRILEEAGIPFEEERMYYGDFWKIEGNFAVEKWLSSDLERPEAIICANDFMAMTVCNALEKRGIRIPEDIAVSGCDDIDGAADFSPSISTARMPLGEMGAEAVTKIHKHICNIEQDKNSYIKTTSVYRESCGCGSLDKEAKERNLYHYQVSNILSREILRNAYMSADLTGLTKLDDISTRIYYYVYENIGFTDFYMCTYMDWKNYEVGISGDSHMDRDILEMEIGIKKSEGCSNIKFERKYLIPTELVDNKPMIFFVAMLHHQSTVFGYVAIAFEDFRTYMHTFQAYMINLSNALENVRVHSELNRLVYKLEDMYIRDELTGLYNRRALEILGQKYLKQAISENAKLMVFTADMDKLKVINDNYGHANGDIAIKTVADALQAAADDDEICMRCGGDEFTAIGLDYDDKKMLRFITKFVEALDEFNNSGKYEFKVFVSYGWHIITPENNTTIEECMIISDSKMYQQKYEKEAMRMRVNLVR